MNQWHENLPSKWKEKLAKFIKAEFNEDRSKLSATDFRYNLTVSFQDGSYLAFQDAFYLLDREANEFAVFTEHCGYHIFPLGDTRLQLSEPKWVDVEKLDG